MRTRIDILKDIMSIEKRYALEEIDSEEFETKLLLLEKQLKNASELSDEELKNAIDQKEIPLSANQLIGRVSIEDLLPNYNVPRTFFRHLKIRREIKELERNIDKLQHDIHKIKVLMAEKKVNHDTALLKIETLEFDLRLAKNRYSAREKYLKRNPTKGDLLKFSLQNFLKFSFGHGIENDAELLVISEDLKEEIILRQKYRDALAELLATVKTSQIDIRAKTGKSNIPDFKKLRELQATINELQDYIKLLSKDISDFNGCLIKLEKNYLELDEAHELYLPERFGIDIGSSEEIETKEVLADESVPKSDPLLEALAQQDETKESALFLIDILELKDGIEDEEKEEEKIPEPIRELKIPETPQPSFSSKLDFEITGMQDFDLPFNIKGSPKRMNELTEKVIYESFESHLVNILKDDLEAEVKEEPVVNKDVVVKKKVKFTSLSEEVKKIKEKTSEKPPPPPTESITPSIIEAEEDIDETVETIEEEIIPEKELISAEVQDVKIDLNEISSEIPSIPKVETKKIETEEISTTPEIVTPVPPPPQEDLVKPQKTAMVSEKLVKAATEAWKLTGKGLFDLKDDGSREFLGYLQEVVVFDNQQLGFTLVSEITASQIIIDKIFDQIKPLWVSEELIEDPVKRKLFVIQEVVDSLQIQRDVALHISKLQEFSNFRNINFPEKETNYSQEILGLVPLNKLRIKRGSVICNIDDLLSPKPYRTAPWSEEIFDEKDNNPIGKELYYNYGSKIGKIIAIIKHPLMGQLLLVDTKEPDQSLVNYLVERLEITEEDYKEKIWLAKYLIAKQLRIPEGDALTPKTLINYSLQRGFPILPNEILNSFRVFITGGSINSIKRSKVVLKNSSRVYHPSEVIPIDCLRIRSTQGRHLGTCLGVSLAEKPVLLVSERLSREIVQLFSNANVEKEVMSDISDSVIGSIGVELKDSLCPHNILKTLIVGRKIQTLTEYGYYLSKMNVSGIDLSRIQVVEKGTVYIATLETFTNPNIFAD